MAYFLQNKETGTTLIIEDKVKLSEVLNVSRTTVYNRFKEAKVIETPKYTVYKADVFYPKRKSRGNKYSLEQRREKLAEKEGYYE